MKKVTLVTASTGGIGKAIGIKFLESGYYVIFNYAHNDNKKEECYNELLSRGFKTDSFCFIKADMASDEGIENMQRQSTFCYCSKLRLFRLKE